MATRPHCESFIMKVTCEEVYLNDHETCSGCTWVCDVDRGSAVNRGLSRRWDRAAALGGKWALA